MQVITEDIIKLSPDSENRFIIVDTLSANFRGNENTDDVARLLAQCAKIAAKAKATFLILHHTGKDDGREERGHYSLRANVDFSIKVKSEKDIVRVAVQKLKDAASGEPFLLKTKWVEVNPDSDFNGSLVMVEHSDFADEDNDVMLIYEAALELGDNAPQKALAELLHAKHGWPMTRSIDRKISKALPDDGKAVAVLGHLFSRVRIGSGSKSPKYISVKKDI